MQSLNRVTPSLVPGNCQPMRILRADVMLPDDHLARHRPLLVEPWQSYYSLYSNFRWNSLAGPPAGSYWTQLYSLRWELILRDWFNCWIYSTERNEIFGEPIIRLIASDPNKQRVLKCQRSCIHNVPGKSQVAMSPMVGLPEIKTVEVSCATLPGQKKSLGKTEKSAG